MKMWFAIVALGWWIVLVASTPEQVQLLHPSSPTSQLLGGVASSSSSLDDHHKPLLYVKLTLKIDYDDIATEEAYRNLIFLLRDQLRSDDTSNDIPLLRSPRDTPVGHRNRFVHVELQYVESSAATHVVTLGMDVTNAYVVAYQVGDRSYFFSDAPAGAERYLFTDTNQQTLSYGGSYDDLERQARHFRGQIPLGSQPLRNAIRSLRYGSNVAGSLIVAIQMISEAARFRDIEMQIRRHMRKREPYYPDQYVLDMETSWGKISRAVQNSNWGIFPNEIHIMTDTGIRILDSVSRVIASLALLLYDCKKPKYQLFPLQPLLLRRSSSLLAMISSGPNVGDDDICTIPEPIVHIFGLDNTYIYSSSKDGLWTVKRDGTIRSDQNRCLAAPSYVSGSPVQLRDCVGAGAAARWEIWNNGSIINSFSRLAMSLVAAKLFVEDNHYALRQGFVLTNERQLSYVFIVGSQNLCMQADRDSSAVRLYGCTSDSQEQKWGLFYDGSIRPRQYGHQCLTLKSSFEGISLLGCDGGLTSQRWFFTNEGTILNLASGLVMEANPGTGRIGINAPNQKPNQEWFATASIK